MEDIAAPQAEFCLERTRGVDLAVQDKFTEAGRVMFDDIKYCLDRRSLLILRKVRVNMLAKQARHMLVRRRKGIVDETGDQHLYNRLFAEPMRFRVKPGPVHIVQ